MPASAYGFRASYTMTGPRSEPPMPMLTTVSILRAGHTGPLAGTHVVRKA